MGIDVDGLQILIRAFDRFGAFGDTLQLGRQRLYIAATPEVDGWVRAAGLGADYADVAGPGAYADEGLLGRLGATAVTAADASAYEGAAIVQDFNAPVPDDLHQRFDTVLDFGSTEHIFNVAQSLANLMNLVRVGGRLIACLPANNWLGHGLYQFSPELPFRVFVPENGFRIAGVFLGTMDGAPLREMSDTGAEGVRSEIGRTSGATGLLYIAEKVAHVAPFARRWPQQGDYAAAWRSVAA